MRRILQSMNRKHGYVRVRRKRQLTVTTRNAEQNGVLGFDIAELWRIHRDDEPDLDVRVTTPRGEQNSAVQMKINEQMSHGREKMGQMSRCASQYHSIQSLRVGVIQILYHLHR